MSSAEFGRGEAHEGHGDVERFAQEVLDRRKARRGEPQISVPAAIAHVLDRHGIHGPRREKLFSDIAAHVGAEGPKATTRRRLARRREDAARLQAREEARAGQTYKESGLEG